MTKSDKIQALELKVSQLKAAQEGAVSIGRISNLQKSIEAAEYKLAQLKEDK